MNYLKSYLIFLLLISLQLIQICQAQQLKNETDSLTFCNYIKSILEDTTNKWKEYPKPPALTADILEGIKSELKQDSVKYYFELLSFSNMKTHWDYNKSLSYFEKHQNSFCIIAVTAHWKPDTRVAALKTLQSLIKIRLLCHFTKQKLEELKKVDQVCIQFLIYLLESNPLFISGSENATIHGIYITNILWSLDLLSHEHIIGEKSFREWYKNDLQYEADLLRWKRHLSNKP
ncbi:MAG: hypothetical protein ACOYO1_08595 [Bacteroidales bacterium]